MEDHHANDGQQGHGRIGGEQEDQWEGDLDGCATDVGQTAGHVRGAQVVGEVAVVAPLERLGRPWRVAHHGGDDLGEVDAELREAGSDPHGHDQQLEGDDHVDVAERGKEHDRRQVLLAAGGQEDHLVAQAHDHQQADQHEEHDRVDQAGIVRHEQVERRCSTRSAGRGR